MTCDGKGLIQHKDFVIIDMIAIIMIIIII